MLVANFTDGFFVRHAALSDLKRIVDIYNATVAGRMVTADTEPVTAEERLGWFTEHAPDSRPLWVVQHGEMVCGWLSFQSFYGRPAYAATAEVSVYIDDSFRGRGLGRRLLQEACEQSRSLGIRTLLGFIFGHNGPSLALFERCGFDRWAHLPRVAELDGVERDLVIVGKRVCDR